MLHRLYLVRSLGESARILGIAETQEHLLPILEDLMPDPEPSLRQALVEQIPDFTKFFVESGEESIYTTVLHSLIPMVAELTTDRHLQVRTSATESLIQISSIIHQEDLEPYVLPIVKSLSNDATEEEHRLEAAQLLSAISPFLTQDLCEQFILPLISKLSEDRVFRVRKAIAANLGDLAKSLSEQSILDKIIPIYNKLCSDEIWGVRKACAESLVSIGKSIPYSERYSTLISIFESLVEDESRWVRGSAYQNLGPFISIFDSSQVTPQLLHYYIDMISDIKQAKALGDGEVAMYCAFNFPAVLFTVGNTRWNELSTTYFTLVKDNQWKVRRTLAFSLHEVASILGTDITEHMLLATFELFLKDTDEVKEGVVSNLANFLNVLSPTIRLKYLDLIQELKSSKNWRFRKLIARQLNQLCLIYDIENTNNVIVPLTLHLCQDSFAKVRKVASKGVGLLMKRLVQDNSSLKNEVERQLISFSTHASSYKRQLFIDICENLVNQLDSDLFDTKYLPKLLALQNDKIPNIRQALANVLGILILNEKYSSNTEIISILESLQQDKDKETRFVSKCALDEASKKIKNEDNTINKNVL